MMTHLIVESALGTGFANNGRIVFLLGAGASYSSGYPLMTEFLSPRYLRWLHDQSVGVDPTIGLQEPRLQHLLEEAEALSATSRNIEMLLTEAYDSPEDYRRVWGYILNLLGAAEDLSTHSRPLHVSLDMLFAAFVLHSISGFGSCGVISFNYDLALETAACVMQVMITGRRPASGAFDYLYPDVTSLATGPNMTGSHLPPRYTAGGIPIAKLHGSMNILHCPECDAMYYTPYEMVSDLAVAGFAMSTHRLKAFRCATCGGQLAPLLVPPGKRKQIPSGLNHLWLEAQRMLERAELVVLVGYSIPPYDHEARDLLRNAITREHHVVLVDPYPNDDTLTFIRDLTTADVTVLKETATSFFRNEMEEGMPLFITKFAAGCTQRRPYEDRMRGVER